MPAHYEGYDRTSNEVILDEVEPFRLADARKLIGRIFQWGLRILRRLITNIFELVATVVSVPIVGGLLWISFEILSIIFDALAPAFPFSAIAISSWTAWFGIPLITRKPLSSSSSLTTKWMLKFINKSIRPLTLCIAIATSPHTLFLLLWQAIPLEPRLHSSLGHLLVGYETVVLALHETLGLYDNLGALWWGAIVLTVGWIAVELSRPWLLERFLSAERYLSRVAFTLLIAAYFTVTTAHQAPPIWDPNIPRHLELVLRGKWEAAGHREIAEAVTSEIATDPGGVNRVYAVPAAIYQWPEPDLKNRDPKLDEATWRRVRQARYETDPVLRLSSDDRKEIEREVARDVAIKRADTVLNEHPETQGIPDRLRSASAFPNSISEFQRARNQTDELRERAKVARKAAAEAFVHAAGIDDIVDIPIVKDLFKEMLEASAEEISSKTIDRVPADLILADISTLSERVNRIVRPDIWRGLAKKLVGGDDHEHAASVVAISTEITGRVRKRAEEQAERNRVIEEARRAVVER
jgi:hypothetical protein